MINRPVERAFGALGLMFCLTMHSLAATLDWSSVTLSGSYPDFTFTDPALGIVNIDYSSDTEISGIQGTLTLRGPTVS